MAITRLRLQWRPRLAASPAGRAARPMFLRRRGPKLYPVHGQVLYEGKPASGAVVFFHPQGASVPKADNSAGEHVGPSNMPIGKVGPDGSFELTTGKSGRGAPPGLYAVTILWTVQAVSGG